MAQRVRITLENDCFDDELGRPTTMTAERVYELPEGLQSLSQIEAAVAELKQAALPELEKELLNLAQKRFVADQHQQQKKGSGGSATAGVP
jgi:L-lactate utilization protein LutB